MQNSLRNPKKQKTARILEEEAKTRDWKYLFIVQTIKVTPLPPDVLSIIADYTYLLKCSKCQIIQKDSQVIRDCLCCAYIYCTKCCTYKCVRCERYACDRCVVDDYGDDEDDDPYAILCEPCLLKS